MSEKEIKKMIAAMKKFKKTTANSSEKSKEFLKKAGIIDKKGNLKEHYK